MDSPALDVEKKDESKDHSVIPFVVVAHVDAGKSSFCGHLLKLCGFVDDHQMDEIERKAIEDKMEKCKFARILDIYPEEQIRGKTHDFSDFEFTWKDQKYIVIDTPGHRCFIRSMIQGMSLYPGAIGCLIVSVPEFISGWENGTTKEDIVLLRAVGVKTLIVLMNKMDLVGWDCDLYDKCKNTVLAFIKRVGGMDIKFIPISGYKGIGLVNTDSLPSWYTGPSFIDVCQKSYVAVDSKTDEAAKPQVSKKCDKFLTDFMIFTCENIISGGYQGILHHKISEFDCSIIGIQNSKGLKFGKQGERVKCLFKVKDATEFQIGDRVILRKGEATIGFGRIIKV